jgi:hypothetical protein
MKRLQFDAVKPGDIILTARRGFLSRSIRFFTGGDVSHAMICVQFGSCIDSTSIGVQARNLQREFFESDEQAFHFRLKQQPSNEVLQQITDFARSEIGSRYSILEAAGSLVPPSRKGSNKQFCSRLVARAYKKAGFDLVQNSDYCSPKELRHSSLLYELPIDFEQVSDEELAWLHDNSNPIQRMHEAQNTVLQAARSIDKGVENFGDLYNLLSTRPEADQSIAKALRVSGYLDIWRSEVEKHPWRYSPGLIDQISAPHDILRAFCVAVVSEAYSGGRRFALNLAGLRELNRQSPRESFHLLIILYEILVRNDQSKREIAYDWLGKHYPDQLKNHMEEVEPHSSYWRSTVERVEPRLAALSDYAVTTEGRKDVCSSCGDRPVLPYRLVNGAETMPGVPSLYLCTDCLKIRRDMGNVLMPFLNKPMN